MSQTDLLRDVVRELIAANVGYLVTGSIASSLHGESRATHDVDIVVQVDLALPERLAAAFDVPPRFFDAEAAREALQSRTMFCLIETSSGAKVDFWPLTDDPFDASRFARRIKVELLGTELFVSAPEDTILQKLKWASAMGGSERQFNDAVGVYEVQRGSLDEGYLDAWAARLGVSDALSAVRVAASE